MHANHKPHAQGVAITLMHARPYNNTDVHMHDIAPVKNVVDLDLGLITMDLSIE